MMEIDKYMRFEDIAKYSNLSYGTVHPALKDLVEFRILKTKLNDKSRLYCLNKSIFFYPELKSLFEAEREKPIKIAESFAKSVYKRGIINLILFGSLARGEFKEKSDIDILVIYKGSKETIDKKLYEEVQRIIESYDIFISVTYMKQGEYKEKLKRMDDFIVKLAEEGKVLYGDLEWLKK
ncbi:MAG: nucleotidyltransferase domain-containing protein [Candidatus Aenigmarchaeota archaeon]|nr:nucleotidyltransferase domain-containing protein [Candidatus Aenigmarchaeota archaeon]